MDIITYIIVAFALFVITYKIKKQNIPMKTLVWPYLMLICLFIIMYPPLLNKLTKLLGFVQTENLIFFILCGYLFIITIVHEVRIAKLHSKINDLTRNLAIHKKESDDNNCND